MVILYPRAHLQAPWPAPNEAILYTLLAAGAKDLMCSGNETSGQGLTGLQVKFRQIINTH